MTCPKCGQAFTEKCECGHRLSTALAGWVVQHCATPGCGVAIRVRIGQQEAVPVCKRCLNNTAYNVMNAEPPC